MEIIFVALGIGLITVITLLIIERLRAKKPEIKLKHEKVSNEVTNKSTGKPTDKLIIKLTDYTQYHMSLYEQVFYSLIAGIVLFLIAYIFYQNIYVSIVFSLFGFFYPRIKKNELTAKRKQELLLQFKQALYSISTALSAGKSIENAFKEATSDLKLLYPNPNTYIIQELDIINRRIENGEPIEKALSDFSVRTNIEDIANFTDVFVTCKRTGGDLVEVIRRSSTIIGEKIDIQQEINVLIAQKKFEAKILSVSPFFMIAIVSFSSPDYMQPLYELGIGPVVMTISLGLLALSYWLIKWIMDIKV